MTGSYGPPECLEETARCVPGYTGDNLLVSLMGVKQGYLRTFHAGSPAPNATSQARELTAFAVVAVPVLWGKTGKRSFCGDSGGGVYVLRDPQPPPMGADATCLPPWKRLR